MANGIAKNTGVILFGNSVTSLIDFIVIVYLARFLGTEGFGLYSFIFTYVTFFQILGNLGTQRIVIRELVRKKDLSEKIVGNFLILKTLLSLFAIAVALIFANLLGYSDDERHLIYLASVILFTNSAKIPFFSLFNANLRMEYTAISQMIRRIIFSLLILVIIFLKGGIEHIILGAILADAITFFVSYRFSRKFAKIGWQFDLVLIKKILKASLPLAFTQVFFIIYYRIDVLMLSVMRSFKEVGYYSAAYKPLDGSMIIPIAVSTAIFPVMTKHFKESRESFYEVYEQSFRVLLTLALPIAIYTTVYAEEIIKILYGAEFLPASRALKIMMWSGVFLFIRPTFNAALISMDRELSTSYITGFSALFNVVSNFIMIPRYGFFGASVTTLLTQAIEIILFYLFTTRLIRRSLLPVAFKPILIAGLLYLSLFLLGFLPPIALIVLSGAAYLWLTLRKEIAGVYGKLVVYLS
jgi:O-antigen/teichoic acid export membrane protein